jgi:hypothetical protein
MPFRDDLSSCWAVRGLGENMFFRTANLIQQNEKLESYPAKLGQGLNQKVKISLNSTIFLLLEAEQEQQDRTSNKATRFNSQHLRARKGTPLGEAQMQDLRNLQRSNQ